MVEFRREVERERQREIERDRERQTETERDRDIERKRGETDLTFTSCRIISERDKVGPVKSIWNQFVNLRNRCPNIGSNTIMICVFTIVMTHNVFFNRQRERVA